MPRTQREVASPNGNSLGGFLDQKIRQIPGIGRMYGNAVDGTIRLGGLILDLQLIKGGLASYDPEADARKELQDEEPLLLILSIAQFQNEINAGRPQNQQVSFLNPREIELCQIVLDNRRRFDQFLHSAVDNEQEQSDGIALRNYNYFLRRGQKTHMTPADRLRFELDATQDELIDLWFKYGNVIGSDNSYRQEFFLWQEYKKARDELVNGLTRPIDEGSLQGKTKLDLVLDSVQRYVAGEGDEQTEKQSSLDTALTDLAHEYVETSLHDLQVRAGSNQWASDEASRKALIRGAQIIAPVLGFSYGPAAIGFLADKLGVPLPQIDFSINGTPLEGLHLPLWAKLIPLTLSVFFGAVAVVKALAERQEDEMSLRKEAIKRKAYQTGELELVDKMSRRLGVTSRYSVSPHSTIE